MTIGKRVLEARENAGLSVETMANDLGITAEQLIGIESDEQEPNNTLIALISKVTGVNAGYIAFGGNNASQESKKTLVANTVGDRIKHTRQDRDLSVSELAEKTGMSEEDISAIESGTLEPNYLQIDDIAKALSESSAWLAFGGAK